MPSNKHHFREHWERSLAKAATYRVIILILDFVFVFLLTGRYEIALAFMVASNTYSTIIYYFHERLWNRVHWGKSRQAKSRKR